MCIGDSTGCCGCRRNEQRTQIDLEWRASDDTLKGSPNPCACFCCKRKQPWHAIVEGCDNTVLIQHDQAIRQAREECLWADRYWVGELIAQRGVKDQQSRGGEQERCWIVDRSCAHAEDMRKIAGQWDERADGDNPRLSLLERRRCDHLADD